MVLEGSAWVWLNDSSVGFIFYIPMTTQELIDYLIEKCDGDTSMKVKFHHRTHRDTGSERDYDPMRITAIGQELSGDITTRWRTPEIVIDFE